MAGPLGSRVVLRVTGTVQGVGFRPFVYREAVSRNLVGTVCNDAAGVLIEVEGPGEALESLCDVLRTNPPPLAAVTDVVKIESGTSRGDHRAFRIIESPPGGIPAVPVAVDSATCDDCLSEVFDPQDRRHRYAFTNCTNCGPRYTIVERVPYDRPTTTMAAFVMCDDCRSEFHDPADRRFHAQPNACPACGPTLVSWTSEGDETARAGAALEVVGRALRDGRIVAIKGLGGYHLAADATDDAAVARLRERKARDHKPFALMVPSLDAAADLCVFDDLALDALCSVRRPIVLVPQRPGAGASPLLAPRLSELGLMLPYTPLHHLLLADLGRPLVMTSGNHSDEPIVHDDGEAVDRLGLIADVILTHDRGIHIRCDDSVVRSVPASDSAPARLQVLRRSRGLAPEPIRLPIEASVPILAVGAELKNTVAVTTGVDVVASHHIGDLSHLAAHQSFVQAVEHLPHLYGVVPVVIAHDLHPEYLSTKWAAESDLVLVGVQHHHAHVAACMVEHGRTGPVLGVAFDGLGYGTDGTLWGGEFFDADLWGYTRLGHLATVALPGGPAAVREPWRMALAWLDAAGPGLAERIGPQLDVRWPAVLALSRRDDALRTSSVGRLFDAVAAIMGIRSVASYEGQAAIELEALARRGRPWPLCEASALCGDGGVLDPAQLIAAVFDSVASGSDLADVAAGFHRTLADAVVSSASRMAHERSLQTVVLTGGVFQNALLSDRVATGLHRDGFEVLVHADIPPNDGGISIGQAAVAAATMQRAGS